VPKRSDEAGASACPDGSARRELIRGERLRRGRARCRLHLSPERRAHAARATRGRTRMPWAHGDAYRTYASHAGRSPR